MIISLIMPFLISAQTSQPIPPGGIDAFTDYVNKNLIQNERLKNKELKGILELEFRVNQKGVIDSFDIVKDLEGNFAIELVKVIKSAGGWTPANIDGNSVATWVNMPFEIPGGIITTSRTAMPSISIELFKQKFLSNFRYPEKAINARIQGDFKLVFTVKKDGSLTSIKLLKDPGYGIEEAAIRALSRSGKWLPAHDKNGPYESETEFEFTLSLKVFRRHI